MFYYVILGTRRTSSCWRRRPGSSTLWGRRRSEPCRFYISIYLSLSLSIYLFFSLSLSIYLSIYLSMRGGDMGGLAHGVRLRCGQVSYFGRSRHAGEPASLRAFETEWSPSSTEGGLSRGRDSERAGDLAEVATHRAIVPEILPTRSSHLSQHALEHWIQPSI